jgi:hypothetical protein
MCAVFRSPDELKKLRKRKKPIRAWKVLWQSGQNSMGGTPGITRCFYGPGTVKAKGVNRTTAYGVWDVQHQCFDYRGLHVYRSRQRVDWVDRTIPVYIEPEDLIAAEARGVAVYDGVSGSQLVACRLTIRPEDWESAGLPKRATRRRYV